MSSRPTSAAALSPTFAAVYALPKIAILPLLLVIFGLGETPKVLAVGAVLAALSAASFTTAMEADGVTTEFA